MQPFFRRQEYPTSPHLRDDPGPPSPTSLTIVSIASSWTSLCTTLYGWMTRFWVGFQLTLDHLIWMDDKFLGWVSTHFVPPLWMDDKFWVGSQLTLYHLIWMDDKFLGWVNCLQVGAIWLSILLAYSHFLLPLVLLGKLTLIKVTPMAWNPTRHED
jgi:hypothetical protein